MSFIGYIWLLSALIFLGAVAFSVGADIWEDDDE